MIERDRRDEDVQRHGREGRDQHVVHAQQVEAGRETSQHRAGDIAAVEESEPRHAFRRGLHPSGHGRQRRAHQQRRRQQADGGGKPAQQDADHARAGNRRVDPRQRRHPEQHEDADETDAELEVGVDLERMMRGADPPRQQDAAEAHAAHERAEQNAEGDRGGPDGQLQQLKPDDFINQCGTAAADEEQQQCRQVPARGHANTFNGCE